MTRQRSISLSLKQELRGLLIWACMSMLLIGRWPSESLNKHGWCGFDLLQRAISTNSTESSGKTSPQAITASASKIVSNTLYRGEPNLGRKMAESKQIDLSRQP